MYNLRPYQEKGKNDIINFLNKSDGSKKGVAIAPCAAGKSLYIASSANELDSPLLIIQPSKELLIQNYNKYISYDNEASIYSASLKSKEMGHVTFATPGSIAGKAEQFKRLGVKHVLIDESHYQCKTESQIDGFIKALGKDSRVVGLTASPVLLRNGMYGAELKMLNRTSDSIFNSIIHCTQIKEVVDGGFWCDIKYEIHRQNNASLRGNSNGSEFTDQSLRDYFYDNDLEGQIISAVERIRKQRQSILIFLPTIAEAEKVASKIKGAACVHSKISPSIRDGIIKGFRNGFIEVVVNVNVLATGFDHPPLSCVINASPTMSIARWYQQAGRGVRIHPGKEDYLLVDFSGNFDRFGRLEGITFEDVPEVGWHMLNNGKVLTATPIQGIPPTREEMIEEAIKKKAPKDASGDIVIWFGKFKDRKLSTMKSKDEIGWMQWLLFKSNFDFSSQKMKELKSSMEKIVGNLRT